jgi:cytochrome c-type biogenesis protein CcmH/NrfG
MRPFLHALVLCLISVPLFAQSHAELFASGRAALQRDEHEKAADLFEKAIKLSPNNAQYHYYLGAAWGEIAQEASVFKQASMAGKIKAEFEKAVKLDPNFIEARFALIDFYTVAPGFMGGSMEKAMNEAAEIKKRNNVEGHRAYARIYGRQKKPDLMRKEFVDMVKENPTSPRAHYLYAAILINEKNWPAALQEIETALRLDPNYMPNYYRLGQYAAASGTIYPRGEEALRKYLGYKHSDQEPNHASTWYFLGLIQEKQGKKAEAKASYTNAKKLAPKAKDITEALKRVS